MDTDPPADVLAAANGHGKEVAGINIDGGKVKGQEMNEYGGEESGEEDNLPKPKPKIIYNTVVFRKSKICIIRHKKGKQKQTTHEFSASRAAIGIHNYNIQKISSALVGDYQLRYSHRSPTKADVKRDRIYLKRALNHLKTSSEWRGGRVEKLVAEKRGLLARINDDKK